VLDGQQRITSLYAAYCKASIQKEGEKKITEYENIFVDLGADLNSGDDQVVVSERPESSHLTLNEVLNFNDNLLEIQNKFTDEEFKKIHEYSQIFSTYDFSTIVLRREDIDSAIEVFTRINTGGQKLTLFEIMSAKTYDESAGFDMAEKFKTLLTDLSDQNYETISSSVILSAISLVLSKNKECKRKVILQLNKEDIINIWDEVISALKESIDYFRSVYRIPVSTLLPYDSLLVPFTYYFYYNKQKPKGDQAKYLEEFFWRISLSARYSSSTESKLAQDIRRIDEILDGKRPNYDDIKISMDSPKDIIETNFSAGSSVCKAILCLLAYNEPKDFVSNGRVILDNSYLKAANSRNYHHFFPKAYLRKKNIRNANSIVNITLVSDELNKRQIRAKAPSVYVSEFKDDNDELDSALQSHLINDIDAFGIMSDDYDVFLKQRAEAIYSELIKRIELKNKSTGENQEVRELILLGENEETEFKSTMRFDMREGAVNSQKLEPVIAKTISAFLNSEGGNLFIGIDDEGNALGLEPDLNTLKKSDTDGFELHLRNLIKKYLGENFEKYIKVEFPTLDQKQICHIKVSKSGKPVFVNIEGQDHFYVRNGNSSVPKNRQEQSEYEKIHWGI
jgi:hypothetical protein